MKQDLSWLTNPEVFQVNRLDAHSDHVSYASKFEIENNETSLRQSLNGDWLFDFSETIDGRSLDFWEKDFNPSSFNTIPVPSHIELNGYGQLQYINTLYPWDGHKELHPPEIDYDNTTVGSYIKTFDLEPSLQNKKIAISFQGVERAFYVWLNGEFVGYSEDTFTPSDFDLTPYIKNKDNTLCVQVFQNSSASWIEDQDMFRFSGIFRDVFLYAKPDLHLEDLWLKANLNEDNETGDLIIRVKIEGDEDFELHCQIKDPDGKEIIDKILELDKKDNYFYSQKFEFDNVKIWDHKSPNLYSVLLTLKNKDEKTQEVIPYKFGFRRVEIKDGIIQLNGKRLLINGVNRHEWSPTKGRAIDIEDMEEALETFKRNNINAVRTSHYPNQTPWYFMMDENGIYVMDETNLESHGSWMQLMKVIPDDNVPGSHPEWKEAVIDRARSMFERDKNHPSILFWSVGNESYAGEDMVAMTEFFHEIDPSRPVHYEGVFHNREFNQISDIESRMYETPENVRIYLENNPEKPFILCEYMHDMGNSLGGLETYINLSKEFDKYQGGFVWDYMDQALYKTEDGVTYLGYGGDFDERQSDYNFSGNGIVFADGTEKPAMQDLKYWYLPEEERLAFDEVNKVTQEKLAKEIEESQEELSKTIKENEIIVTNGAGAIGVKDIANTFEVLFSRPEKGISSIRRFEKEWIWRAPSIALWRAPTENDIGSGFDKNSGIWQAVEKSLNCDNIVLEEKDKYTAKIRYDYSSPAMKDFKASIVYTVDSVGRIKVEVIGEVPEDAPQLPVFGLRFATPRPVDEIEWIGLSGETYPDRYKGAKVGTHREEPHIADYLVPQETGNHYNTLEATLISGENTLDIIYDKKPFSFSAIPYTPQQLQEAYHKHELPKPVRTVITVAGYTRGVGGIDSWGTDVEEYAQIKEKDLKFSFYIMTNGQKKE